MDPEVRVVVVARDREHRGDAREALHGAQAHAERRRVDDPAIEQIARNDDGIDPLALGERDDLGESRLGTRRVRSIPKSRLPRCQSPVWSSFTAESVPSELSELGDRRGRRRRIGDLAATWSPRAGRGSRRRSGAGTLGWLTSTRPCISRRARARAAGPSQPYSLRSASAASRRPAIRMAAFWVISDATSDACCWAPIRITPSERPRWAMSIRVSLIGESPSRGAYLLSSSSTTNSIGSRVAGLLRGEGLREQGADHEPLGEVVEPGEVHHRDGRLVLGRRSARDRLGVRAHEPAQPPGRALQPADEGLDRPGGGAAGPGAGAVLVVELGDQPVDQPVEVVEGARGQLARRARRARGGRAVDRAVQQPERAGVALDRDRAAQQLPAHPLLDEAELVAHVGGVREAEPQQALEDELERASSRTPARPRAATRCSGRRWSSRAAAPRRRRRGSPRSRSSPRRSQRVVQLRAVRGFARVGRVGLVEEQQVLALDVEQQHPHPAAHVRRGPAAGGSGRAPCWSWWPPR